VAIVTVVLSRGLERSDYWSRQPAAGSPQLRQNADFHQRYGHPQYG
jgi:hypothetical protein